jgi:hypothetical protein
MNEAPKVELEFDLSLSSDSSKPKELRKQRPKLLPLRYSMEEYTLITEKAKSLNMNYNEFVLQAVKGISFKESLDPSFTRSVVSISANLNQLIRLKHLGADADADILEIIQLVKATFNQLNA